MNKSLGRTVTWCLMNWCAVAYPKLLLKRIILICRGGHDLVPGDSGTQAFPYLGLLRVS